VSFCIQVSALQANKMAGVIENYSKFEVRPVVRFLQTEGVSQSEIQHRLVSIYGQKFSSERKCLCGATNLKMADCMLIQRNTEADEGLRTPKIIVYMSKD
jgi:hypothetical protein